MTKMSKIENAVFKPLFKETGTISEKGFLALAKHDINASGSYPESISVRFMGSWQIP